MSSPNNIDLNDYVFRRLRRGDYSRSNGDNVKARAFSVDTGESLSVFSMNKSPRDVLQEAINDQNIKLRSPNIDVQLKAQTWLNKQGDTVEVMVTNGWGVAKIKISEFIKNHCTLDEEEPNGHINVWYPDETIILQSELRGRLADEAKLLTEEECKQ